VVVAVAVAVAGGWEVDSGQAVQGAGPARCVVGAHDCLVAASLGVPRSFATVPWLAAAAAADDVVVVVHPTPLF